MKQTRDEVALLLAAARDKCVICGEDRTAALDLHHVDPATKSFNLGSSARNKGVEAVLRELAKCVPVCSVCHRLIHAGELSIEEGDLERTRADVAALYRQRFCGD